MLVAAAKFHVSKTGQDVGASRPRIEHDARLTALEAAHDLRDLGLEGDLPLSVVGAFPQHESLDEAPQRRGREGLVRHLDRMLLRMLVAH